MSSLIASHTLRRFLTVLCVAVCLSWGASAALAQPHHGNPHFVKYFPLEIDFRYESYALVGHGNQYWFTSNGSSAPSLIGSFNGAGGVVSNVTLHYVGGNPASGMPNVVATDGATWATVRVGVAQTFVRLAPDGSFTFYPVPGWNGDGVGALVQGQHGSMWFTTQFQGNIGSITRSGSMRVVSVGGQTQGICAGPNGSAWFTIAGPPVVGVLSGSGAVTEYQVPTSAQTAIPGPIVAGPDGNFWFTSDETTGIGSSSTEQDYIVKVTPAGSITKYPTPTAAAGLSDIVVATDGNLWSTERKGWKLVRTTTSGSMTEFPLPADPDGGANAWGITRSADPANALWFLNNSGYVGLFELD